MDLFLGGLGVGAFIYAICVMFYKKRDDLVSVKVGSVIGPVAMALGLLFMIFEMGQPLRMWKTLVRFNFTSTLSWGGILQEGFILFSAIFAFLLLTNRNKNMRRSLGIFAGIFAIFVAFYHGFLLSFVTARPLWNAGAVSIGLIVSSVNTGIAAVLLLTSFSKRGREEILDFNLTLRTVLPITLITQMATGFIWIVTLITGKSDFTNAYHLMNQHFGVLLWGGAILIGLILPFAILIMYGFGPRKDRPLPITLVCVPILIGAFIFRYVLILAGQIS
ncbi:MAG: polysulfide reductase NrfD [Omnitrophica bacterium]|nr:polysulfide reductase NrfD [Candidatus Omnitrophota bacterium]